LLASITAAIATIATFSKEFVPFYLIGSTPIFASLVLIGLGLAAASSIEIAKNARYVRAILVLMGLLYGVVTASFFFSSLHEVPVTYLIGILAFHSIFLLFGFAAARALKAVFFVLFAQAAVYVAVIVEYTIRFGDLMRDGYLHDIFGIGISSRYVTTFHQQIGESLSLAILAALGLVSKRSKLVIIAIIPIVLAFMFHIAARGAIVSLVCGLFFVAWAKLWTRSRKWALAGLSVAAVSAVLFFGSFYEYALHDRQVNAIAPDAVSRSIREIQSQDPGFRLPIWERTWDRIASEKPDRLLLGRGIGTFPIDEGVGPPDWLLRKTEGAAHYPHNVYLELLYEAGIAGLLIFCLVTLFPLIAALRSWSRLSYSAKAAVSIYVFYLTSDVISGAFAYGYDFQFFLALAIGTIAMERAEMTRPALAGSATQWQEAK
jgi:O-antigen ligase